MIRLFINKTEYTNYITDTPVLSAEFEDGKLIGNAPSVCFNVTLDNSDKTFNSLLNEEFIVKDYKTNNQIGVFKVVEKPERITNELVLSLYDNMIETNIAYDTDTTMYPTTIKKQIEEMEVMLSRTIDTSELGNTVLEYPAKWYDNTISIRDFLCFIGELGACNLFCKADGNYMFKKITKTSKHSLPISDVETVDVIEDFECTRVMFDNSAIIPIEKGNETGNTIFVSKDNSYIDTQEQIDYIYSCVSGLRFKTMESMICVEMQSLYLGDIFTFNNINFIALKYSHELLSGEFGIQTIDGNLVIKNAELVTQHIDNTLKIHRLKTEFDQEKLKWSVTAQEVEGQNEKIAQLELSTDEIKQSITKVEETVQKIDTTYYHAELICSGTSITRDNSSITMSVKLLDKSDEVPTSDSVFNWKRVSGNSESDTAWNNAHKARKSITITSSDLEASANFYCDVSAAEWQGSTSAVTVVDETKVPQLGNSFLDVTGVRNIQTLNTDGSYSPSWAQTNPIITPSVIDGVLDVSLSECTISYKRLISGTERALEGGETVKDGILTISKNVLSKALTAITYVAYITYKGVKIKLFTSFSLNVIGQDGNNGNDGRDGKDGKGIVSRLVYHAVSTSKTIAPTSGWTTATITRPKGQYLWEKEVTRFSDGTEAESSPIVISGEDGNDGIQGPKGADGKTYYTWLKYADSPTTGMSDSPTGKAYIGLAYNKETAIESSNYSDYSWSLVKGPQGEQGVPGGKGSDGKTYYTWIKYATSASGAGMSDDPTGKTYIGLAYNKETATESTNASDYTWALIKGEKGDAGKGIKSYAITYQASSSGTIAPTGTWSSTIPTVQQGQYLWSRTITTYTDNATSTAYSVSYIPVNGTSVSVKSTSVMYQVSTNGTTVPTGEWKSSIPTVPKGQYLWTRTIVMYTDDKSTTAYSVSYQPTNGANGTSVTVSSTKTTYQASSSGTTVPTGTWSDSPVAGTAGQYVWTRTIVTYSDGKSTTSYSISRNGNNGATGATGTSTASTVQQYFLSTSKVNPTGGTWTITPPTWSSGKYLWTRFVITYKNPASTEYTVPVCDSSWEAVNEIEVGGRNLLLKSNYPVTNTSYPTKTYTMAEKMVANETYTCTLWGTLGTGKSYFGLWLDGGNIGLGSLVKISDGIYQLTFKGKTGTLDTSVLHVYPVASTVSAESTITKIKLEKGNKPTDWSPAPEDINQDIVDAEVRITESYNSAIKLKDEEIRQFVTKSVEEVGDWESALNTLRNEVVLTKDSTEFLKTSSQIIKDLQTGKVDINEIKEWARFTGAILELGASNSEYKVRLSPTELGFYQGSTKVAWISNNELNVTKIVARESITIKTFIFVDEGSYGFTLKKVGG